MASHYDLVSTHMHLVALRMPTSAIRLAEKIIVVLIFILGVLIELGEPRLGLSPPETSPTRSSPGVSMGCDRVRV